MLTCPPSSTQTDTRIPYTTLFRSQAPAQPSPLSYNDVLLRNLKKRVEKHHTELRLPKDYAALLYITPNHLNAICSDLLGQSARSEANTSELQSLIRISYAVC